MQQRELERLETSYLLDKVRGDALPFRLCQSVLQGSHYDCLEQRLCRCFGMAFWLPSGQRTAASK
jgi:hypothetical protein